MEEEIEQLKQRLQQVHQSSTEIENVLELEIESKNEECQSLQSQLELAVAKIVSLEQSSKQNRDLIRTLEARIEDLERNKRINEVTLAKLEQENQVVLEELALKSLAIEEKNDAHVELQRSLQNLRDAQDEIVRLETLINGSVIEPNMLNVKSQSDLYGPNASRILNTAELRSNEWKKTEGPSGNLKTKKSLPTSQLGRGHGEKIQ